jgi:type IV pilus assembly protein PilN
MIKINLLPFRAARKKENVRRQLTILFGSLILVFILLIYYNIRLSSDVKEIKSKVEATKTEHEKYEKINKEIEERKAKLATLNAKMDIIKTLETNRYEPIRLMDAMTSLIVPKRMWFVSFDAKGNTVNMSGIAVDNQTVADFMTRLERSKLFETVNLKTLKQNMIKQSVFKSFEISCTKPVKKEEKKELPKDQKAPKSKAKK